ncbi:hypothetical protein [Micromonospora sp. NPDC007230]|uniref:hypothetical protein n=1 Tax=Micromonospora sp. NPDC007230 TaxID=3364237 RepID=UPI0036ABFD2B
MAVEWNSRVNRAFTLRAALELTQDRFGGLLDLPGACFVVEAHEATRERMWGGASGPVADRVLDIVIDPLNPAPPGESDAVFEIPDLGAAAFLKVNEFVPRGEDPETGMFAWVTSRRTAASQVLSIAATIAFAECGDGEVIDEYGYFKGPRLNSPCELLERLRVTDPQQSVELAVDAVLRKTLLRRVFA